jgi:hypothetical protein
VPPWAQESPSRAAGIPPIKTVVEPIAIVSGGPTQTHISPTRAAGNLPIITVGHPGPTIGPPTCGTGPVAAGQTCISVNLDAGGAIFLYFCFCFFYVKNETHEKYA